MNKKIVKPDKVEMISDIGVSFDTAFSREMRRLLLDALHTFTSKIDEVLRAQDWEDVYFLSEKLLSGVCYFALPTLQSVLLAIMNSSKAHTSNPEIIEAMDREIEWIIAQIESG